MKLYLLRHGETDWNLERRLQGNLNIPLNEKGREIARLTGEGMKDLPFTAAFASTLDRACETAGLILQYNSCYRARAAEYLGALPAEERARITEVCGCPVIRDPRIHEIDLGPWKGCCSRELPEGSTKRLWTDPEGKTLPEGVETLNGLLERGRSFLSDLSSRPALRERTVLVVTHNGFLRALALLLSGGQEFAGPGFRNCETVIAELDENGKVLSLERKLFYDPERALQAGEY